MRRARRSCESENGSWHGLGWREVLLRRIDALELANHKSLADANEVQKRCKGRYVSCRSSETTKLDADVLGRRHCCHRSVRTERATWQGAARSARQAKYRQNATPCTAAWKLGQKIDGRMLMQRVPAGVVAKWSRSGVAHGSVRRELGRQRGRDECPYLR